METETYPTLTTEPDGSYFADTGKPNQLTVLGACERYRVTVHLSDDDLQAIVQAAYDQRGILAEPSLERELARDVDPLREFADAWGEAVSR